MGNRFRATVTYHIMTVGVLRAGGSHEMRSHANAELGRLIERLGTSPGATRFDACFARAATTLLVVVYLQWIFGHPT